ncbi:MAG: phBC6A51 family helix-turn-helix protein [Angelakisella sp.]|nr:phBC6A51 family helix-turn-helix protein [Angelakisella sp.]
MVDFAVPQKSAEAVTITQKGGEAMAKQLTAKQLQAIYLMVYEGMTHTQICIELGVSHNCMTTWTNKEMFQAELRKEMDRRFGKLAAKAVNRLEQLIDAKNDSVALGACKEVLNKAGYKETDKVEQICTTITVSVDEE